VSFPAIGLIRLTFLFLEFDEIPLVGQDICALAFQQATLSASDVLVNSSLASDDVSAESPVQYLQRWKDKHMRLLISCYSKFKNLLGHGKSTKKRSICKNLYGIQLHLRAKSD